MKKCKLYCLLLTIIILVRIAYYIVIPDIYSDNIAHMAIAQNFMEGHGFSYKYISSEKEIYYKTDIMSPPLYPFFLALITFITKDPLMSSFIVQILSLLLMAFTWEKIFNLFKPYISDDGYFYFISLLFVSTSIFNVINTILILALLFLTISLYFTFRFILLEKSKRINIIISSIFSSLLFWIHYSYFFVAFYPTIVLLIIYYLKRSKIPFTTILISFSTSLIISAGLLTYNYLTTGHLNYMENPEIWETGFFVEHLLLINPFFINAFLKSDYLNHYLIGTSTYTLLNIGIQFISFTVFALIVFLYLKLRKLITSPSEKLHLLFIPFGTVFILVILLLLYPSLRYSEIPLPGWTHIGDSRYLSAVFLSIIAVVIILLFTKVNYLSEKIRKYGKMMLMSIIIINLLICIYSVFTHLDYYNYKANDYNHKNDHQDLYNNIRSEVSEGNLPVYIDNDLIVDSFRMSQLAKAATIKFKEAVKIEEFPKTMVFFFTIPGVNKLRDKDQKLLDWAKRFDTKEVGQIRTNIHLYRVKYL